MTIEFVSTKKEIEKKPAKKASEMKNGEVFLGFLQKTAEFASDYGQPLKYHLFILATPAGIAKDEVVSLRGTKIINEELANIERGTLVRIECKGKQKPKSATGKPYNLFEIQTAPSVAKVIKDVVEEKKQTTEEETEVDLMDWD